VDLTSTYIFWGPDSTKRNIEELVINSCENNGKYFI
jgi:hypothetical protein